MREQIEQCGYLVVVRRLSQGLVRAFAFNVQNWRQDRRVEATSEEEALRRLHDQIVPCDGQAPGAAPPALPRLTPGFP